RRAAGAAGAPLGGEAVGSGGSAVDADAAVAPARPAWSTAVTSRAMSSRRKVISAATTTTSTITDSVHFQLRAATALAGVRRGRRGGRLRGAADRGAADGAGAGAPTITATAR